jgi:type II secretory pathway pseudopilin PulG
VSNRNSNAGFSLIETVVSIGILAAVSLGVAQLFTVAAQANRNAKMQTSTAMLAAQKMEQLKSLTWGYDTSGLGLPLTDTTTNLANMPPTTDGTGLNPSPGDALDSNTPGYVDFLDPNGNWVGTGNAPPQNAAYIRRWSIEPLPTNPNNTLVLQVLVTTARREQQHKARGDQKRWRLGDDSWIVGVKTRKAP